MSYLREVQYHIVIYSPDANGGPGLPKMELDADALNLVWQQGLNFPGQMAFSLTRWNPKIADLAWMIDHVKVFRETPAGTRCVFAGKIIKPSYTGRDLVVTCWDYISFLQRSRTGFRVLYPTKTIGTEIVAPEWALAKIADASPFAFVETGTIEDPLALDGTTPIRTNTEFGVVDFDRLFLFYSMAELSMANTSNTVVFEITREAYTRNVVNHDLELGSLAGWNEYDPSSHGTVGVEAVSGAGLPIGTGTYQGSVARTVAGDSVIAYTADADWFPVVPGERVVVDALIRQGTANIANFGIGWYDWAKGYISTTGGVPTPDYGTTGGRCEVRGTAPANAAYFNIQIANDATTSLPQYVTFDDVHAYSIHAFHFWKNRSSQRINYSFQSEALIDYDFAGNQDQITNDIATIILDPTTGQQVEYALTDTSSKNTYRRLQSAVSIKTLFGLNSGSTETDQQKAALARMLTLSSTPPLLMVAFPRQGEFDPFVGCDLGDSFRVTIPNAARTGDEKDGYMKWSGISAAWTPEAGELLQVFLR